MTTFLIIMIIVGFLFTGSSTENEKHDSLMMSIGFIIVAIAGTGLIINLII